MSLLSLSIVALWIAFFVKNSFTIEGALAFVAFYMLQFSIFLVAKGLQLNLEFLKLSTAAYQHFQQQQRNPT